jgi:N-methylhydantoinase B
LFSAPGLNGGSEGAKAQSVIRRAGGGEEVIPSKAATTLRKGDRLVIETAGGGGYGDPHGRPAEHVREDVRNGKVSEEAAHSVYGQARQQ